MLQNKIYQNFLLEILRTFLIIVLSLSLIALTVRAVNFLDLIVESGYPLSIYFTYSNLTGENSGDYTCELFYNPQMEIDSPELILPRTLIKTIDILGREVNKIPNNIIIEIYDDGSSKKRIIID